ncbi:hypothetical protein [Nostoc sp. MG11]|uniref:hypothetical protein n=1 Tax=Nostoc sp. MG11 TaxID=2721166 RepID=UPI001868395D|nr:hypothetical protein [Nostoc sp. MG11]
MKFDVDIASFLLAFVGATSGWIAWWINKVKFEKQQAALERQQAIQQAKAVAEKAVNEERDFNHLVRNQQDISKNITYCFDEVEHQLNDQDRVLQEIKAYLIAYGIANTEVLRKRDSQE